MGVGRGKVTSESQKKTVWTPYEWFPRLLKCPLIHTKGLLEEGNSKTAMPYLWTRRHRRTGTFGLGGAVTLPEKNYTMPKYWEINTLQLQEKLTKGFTIFTSTERVSFKISHTLCPLLTSLLNLVKIRTVFKAKVFASVALSENIYNLVNTVDNCQRSADWQ